MVLDFALVWNANPFDEQPSTAELTTGAADHLRTCDDYNHEDNEPCNLCGWVSQSELSEFKELIEYVSSALGRIRENEKWWGWIGTGMGFLVKAWTAEHHVERFLWSVVALECLLGRDCEKIEMSIAERLGVITHPRFVGPFKEIYDVRSRIVHGEHGRPAYIERRLEVEAFALSRGAALRTIYLLGELSLEPKYNVRNRDSILKAISSLHKKQGVADDFAAKIRSILRARPFRQEDYPNLDTKSHL